MIPRASKKARERTRIVRSLDALVREIVFKRDGYRCVRCGKVPTETVLQLSHIIPKGRAKRLRFETANCLCMCLACHLYWWHKDPIEAFRWFNEKYPGRYEQLQIMERCVGKIDYKMIEIILRAELGL